MEKFNSELYDSYESNKINISDNYKNDIISKKIYDFVKLIIPNDKLQDFSLLLMTLENNSLMNILSYDSYNINKKILIIKNLIYLSNKFPELLDFYNLLFEDFYLFFFNLYLEIDSKEFCLEILNLLNISVQHLSITKKQIKYFFIKLSNYYRNNDLNIFNKKLKKIISLLKIIYKINENENNKTYFNLIKNNLGLTLNLNNFKYNKKIKLYKGISFILKFDLNIIKQIGIESNYSLFSLNLKENVIKIEISNNLEIILTFNNNPPNTIFVIDKNAAQNQNIYSIFFSVNIENKNIKMFIFFFNENNKYLDLSKDIKEISYECKKLNEISKINFFENFIGKVYSIFGFMCSMNFDSFCQISLIIFENKKNWINFSNDDLYDILFGDNLKNNEKQNNLLFKYFFYFESNYLLIPYYETLKNSKNKIKKKNSNLNECIDFFGNFSLLIDNFCLNHIYNNYSNNIKLIGGLENLIPILERVLITNDINIQIFMIDCIIQIIINLTIKNENIENIYNCKFYNILNLFFEDYKFNNLQNEMYDKLIEIYINIFNYDNVNNNKEDMLKNYCDNILLNINIIKKFNMNYIFNSIFITNTKFNIFKFFNFSHFFDLIINLSNFDISLIQDLNFNLLNFDIINFEDNINYIINHFINNEINFINIKILYIKTFLILIKNKEFFEIFVENLQDIIIIFFKEIKLIDDLEIKLNLFELLFNIIFNKPNNPNFLYNKEINNFIKENSFYNNIDYLIKLINIYSNFLYNNNNNKNNFNINYIIFDYISNILVKTNEIYEYFFENILNKLLNILVNDLSINIFENIIIIILKEFEIIKNSKIEKINFHLINIQYIPFMKDFLFIIYIILKNSKINSKIKNIIEEIFSNYLTINEKNIYNQKIEYEFIKLDTFKILKNFYKYKLNKYIYNYNDQQFMDIINNYINYLNIEYYMFMNNLIYKTDFTNIKKNLNKLFYFTKKNILDNGKITEKLKLKILNLLHIFNEKLKEESIKEFNDNNNNKNNNINENNYNINLNIDLKNIENVNLDENEKKKFIEFLKTTEKNINDNKKKKIDLKNDKNNEKKNNYLERFEKLNIYVSRFLFKERNKKFYTKLKKNIFIYGDWTDTKLFKKNLKNNHFKYKFKHFFTMNFIHPFLKPVLDFNIYYDNKNLKNAFKDYNKKEYKYNFYYENIFKNNVYNEIDEEIENSFNKKNDLNISNEINEEIYVNNNFLNINNNDNEVDSLMEKNITEIKKNDDSLEKKKKNLEIENEIINANCYANQNENKIIFDDAEIEGEINKDLNNNINNISKNSNKIKEENKDNINIIQKENNLKKLEKNIEIKDNIIEIKDNIINNDLEEDENPDEEDELEENNQKIQFQNQILKILNNEDEKDKIFNNNKNNINSQKTHKKHIKKKRAKSKKINPKVQNNLLNKNPGFELFPDLKNDSMIEPSSINNSYINYNNYDISSTSTNQYLYKKLTAEDIDLYNQKRYKEIYSCCLVKPNRHIKGFFYYIDKSIIFHSYFNSQNIQSCNNYPYNYCRGNYTNLIYKSDFNKIIELKFENIDLVFKRNYYYNETAFEIFMKNGKIYYFNFNNEIDYILFITNLLKKIKLNYIINDINDIFNNNIIGYFTTNLHNINFSLINDGQFIKISNIFKKWYIFKIKNFDLIILLNILSNRSYNDLTQYPIFPLLLYIKEKELKEFYSIDMFDCNFIKRDLKFSIQTINLMIEEEKNKSFLDYNKLNGIYYQFPINFKSTYKNLEKVFGYKEIFFKYNQSLYINNNFNILNQSNNDISLNDSINENEIFNTNINLFINSNLSNLSENDNDSYNELIPENYYLPEIFFNINNYNDLSNKSIIRNDSFGFSYFLCRNMESIKVSENLNNWIDLIFGCNQKGEGAIKQRNLYIESCFIDNYFKNVYYLNQPYILDEVINGLIPKQLIIEKGFPEKNLKLKNNNLLLDEIKKKVINNNLNDNDNIKYNFNMIKILNDNYNYILINKNVFIIKCPKKNFFSSSTYKEFHLYNYNNKYYYDAIEIKFELFKTRKNFITFNKKNNTFYLGGQNEHSITILEIFNLENNPNCNIKTINKINNLSSIFTALEFAENSEKKFFLIAGDQEGNITIFEIINNELNTINYINSHTEEIISIKFDVELNIFISAGKDKYINIYNFNDISLLNKFYLNMNIEHLFLLNEIFPSIVIYSEENGIFQSFSINGYLLSEYKEIYINNPIIYKDEENSYNLLYIFEKRTIKALKVPFFKEEEIKYYDFNIDLCIFDISFDNLSIYATGLNGDKMQILYNKNKTKIKENKECEESELEY